MTLPVFDADIWSDGALPDDPYPHYRTLRELGPVVYLPHQDAFAVARYQDVRSVLSRSDAFISGRGVMLNDTVNKLVVGTTLASDGKQHDQQKRIILKPLMPRALSEIKEQIFAQAHEHVTKLVARGHFDAVRDLAHYLPVSIVSNLVGLPENGRERMLDWASATFDAAGPVNERSNAGQSVLGEMVQYAMHEAVPGRLKPGSWGASIYEAVDRGEATAAQAPFLMLDFVGPSLDTTINATSNTIWLLAQHPDQWDLIRDNPELISDAVNESLRLESPIQYFTRVAKSDQQIDGAAVPEGSRIVVFYGSANRDERKWEHAERFDIRRRTADHLAFGIGSHACAGMNLARLEIKALLTSLAGLVKRFEPGEPVRIRNNTIRGLATLPIRVH
jgi:cytochrome P450